MDKKIALTVRYHYHRTETLELAAKAGFKYISMGLGEDASIDLFHKSDWEREIMELSKEIKSYGLTCINTHLPCYELYDSSEISNNYIDVAQFRCLKASAILGADVCAYHPRTHLTGGVSVEKSYIETRNELEPLVREAEKQGVLIGVENLPIFSCVADYIYPCYTKDQNRLIDSFDSKNICAVWDTGHAHLMDYDQAEEICNVGSRIKATHIHDNNGTNENDLHNPPFMGTIDWVKILTAFKKINYDGFLTLESSYYHNQMSEGYVKFLYDTVSKLEDMYNEL